MNRQTDEELVKSIQGGDILAFEALVRRYQRRLYAFALKIVRNSHGAEEVVQDVLFSAYKTISRIDTTKKFSSYIFAMTKNSAISYMRKQKFTVPIDAIAERPSAEDSLYDALIKRESRRTLRHMVGSLEQKYRRIISLYYFDELSYEEMSKILKIPINTVRTHLFRAKRELKKMYETN